MMYFLILDYCDEMAERPHLTPDILKNMDHTRHWIQNGAEVNEIIQGFSPLQYAVMNSDLAMIQLLLDYGADVSLKSADYQVTALHLATRDSMRFYEILKLLLENAANCNVGDDRGATPFHWALRANNMQVVQLFLSHGADITTMDKEGRTALHYAALNTVGNQDNLDVIQFVLGQGFDLEGTSHNDYTALHYAARWGSPEGCEFLLKHGARVDKKSSKTGHTPLSLVISASPLFGNDIGIRAQIVKILCEYGANVAHKIRGPSILEIAVERNVDQLIKDALMQHVAIMESSNVIVNAHDLLTIENTDCYRDYYRICLQEFQHMKRAKFYENVSVFNVLMDSDERVVRYAKCEELVKALEARDYEAMFPIYFASLKRRFYDQVKKHRLTALHGQESEDYI